MTESETVAARAAGALRTTLLTRLRAAGIHFSLSLVVFSVALYLILVRWFPGFHFYVDGGWQGVRIMAAVDLVLGPTLTLMIFNPEKTRRAIAFDLSCIGVAQLGALAWGFYAIHGQQPVSVNFYQGEFLSMPVHSLRAQPEGWPRLQAISTDKPVLLYVAEPATDEERRHAAERVKADYLAHEDSLFFRPLAPHWPEVQYFALDPAKVKDKAFQQDLAEFLAARGGDAGQYRFFRYQGGYGSCFMAFSPAGEWLDSLGCEGT